MKKTVLKAIAMSFVLIILVSVLSACNKLGGTYESKDGSSYKFSLFSDKVTWTYLGLPVEGTYEIDEENGKIYITILGDRQEKTYVKDGKKIIIDDVEYIKK